MEKSIDKPIYRVISCSGGKDSTAMVLRMIEEHMPIDVILFCDTGLEFPEMYAHLDKLDEEIYSKIGLHITRLKPEHDFEYYMFDHKVKRTENSTAIAKYGADIQGYGWAGPKMRWCTTKLKDAPREKFLRDLRKKHTVLEYVGIAADEQYRLERERNKNPNHVHPLVDWEMTEADCLKYCYDRGYDWGGLYEQFKRVSCWCCPLQSLSELRQLYKYHPDLWEKLKEWDKRTWRSFRADASVEDLEVRFLLENEFLKSGKSITNKAFHEELKKRLFESQASGESSEIGKGGDRQ